MHRFMERCRELGLSAWEGDFRTLLEEKARFLQEVDGNAKRRLRLLEELGDIVPSRIELGEDRICIGRAEDLSTRAREELRNLLLAFQPWRKGPFDIFGIELDSEWRSDLKWNRFKDHIAPLAGRRILDVGSSCGYYLFRMAAHGPRLALGIEPYAPFFCQYLLLQRMIRHPDVHCLPLKLEEMPAIEDCFDTLFHMGVLYHQRSPLDALKQLAGLLRPGGELVLETLVIEGEEESALSPSGRYAKMNNVFFLPTVSCLAGWLARAGFVNIRCVDRTWTTEQEQRKTDWIQTETLSDFLDPADPRRTVEGYPAPLRAVLLAERR
ncbi:MAG: tRNA 5-methoxyuridine(34)/uridine 5-oxyacetic acid(34) synthase CmoB [Syntrophotaleaceae bacterium]